MGLKSSKEEKQPLQSAGSPPTYGDPQSYGRAKQIGEDPPPPYNPEYIKKMQQTPSSYLVPTWAKHQYARVWMCPYCGVKLEHEPDPTRDQSCSQYEHFHGQLHYCPKCRGPYFLE